MLRLGPKRKAPATRFFPSDCECKVPPFPPKKVPIGSSTTAYRHFIFLSLNYLLIFPTSSMNLVNFFWHKAL